jgi:hypothetical protein
MRGADALARASDTAQQSRRAAEKRARAGSGAQCCKRQFDFFFFSLPISPHYLRRHFHFLH